MKIKRRISALFTVFGFAVCMMNFFQTASAAETTSITLKCFDEEQNMILSDMHWNIYFLGTLEDEKFTYSPEFSQYQDTVLLENLTASELTDFASTLRVYTLADKIPPSQENITDEAGLLTFSGLQSGMYLLTAEKLKSDYRSWKAAPSIITVDASKSDNVVSIAKVRDATLDENETNYSVRKVWMRNKDEVQDAKQVKDASITVEIYKNGELFETQELNEANHWEYSWVDKTRAEWYVVEKNIPRYYTVSYRENIVEYIVVNTVQPPYRDSSITWEWEEETTTGDESSMTDIITDTTPPDNSTTDSADSSETTKTGNSTDIVSSSEGSYPSTTTTTGSVTDVSSQPANTTTKTTVTTTSRTSSSGSGSGSGSGNGSGSSSGNGSGSGNGTGSGNSVQITKLPQTGQLWYPVPILACGGVLMISIGIRLGKKDDEE